MPGSWACKYKGCTEPRCPVSLTVAFRNSGRKGREAGGLRSSTSTALCETHAAIVKETIDALFDK